METPEAEPIPATPARVDTRALTRERGKTLRAPVILDALAEELPDAVIALDFTNRWELLAATLLSAQSPDVPVNEGTTFTVTLPIDPPR